VVTNFAVCLNAIRGGRFLGSEIRADEGRLDQGGTNAERPDLVIERLAIALQRVLGRALGIGTVLGRRFKLPERLLLPPS
jgi:hypothetical protein